jgi:hypothetical protein
MTTEMISLRREYQGASQVSMVLPDLGQSNMGPEPVSLSTPLLIDHWIFAPATSVPKHSHIGFCTYENRL